MSDRDKGVINAVYTAIPFYLKAFWLKHFSSNLRIALREQAALGLYWIALILTTTTIHHKNFHKSKN